MPTVAESIGREKRERERERERGKGGEELNSNKTGGAGKLPSAKAGPRRGSGSTSQFAGAAGAPAGGARAFSRDVAFAPQNAHYVSIV